MMVEGGVREWPKYPIFHRSQFPFLHSSQTLQPLFSFLQLTLVLGEDGGAGQTAYLAIQLVFILVVQ
jgi:hypothetical protein